ncbi:MAG: ribonuclease P protein component [Ornithinimicrobium sp.]
MLPKRHRLRKPTEFTSVLRGGGRGGARRAGTPSLVVHGRRVDPDAQRPARVGFVVSSAVGNSVVRHRVTRQLRGLMADRITHWPHGTDVVVRANPIAAQCDSMSLQRDLDRALARVLG